MCPVFFLTNHQPPFKKPLLSIGNQSIYILFLSIFYSSKFFFSALSEEEMMFRPRFPVPQMVTIYPKRTFLSSKAGKGVMLGPLGNHLPFQRVTYPTTIPFSTQSVIFHPLGGSKSIRSYLPSTTGMCMRENFFSTSAKKESEKEADLLVSYPICDN